MGSSLKRDYHLLNVGRSSVLFAISNFVPMLIDGNWCTALGIHCFDVVDGVRTDDTKIHRINGGLLYPFNAVNLATATSVLRFKA